MTTTSTPRKPRADSKLDALPTEKLAELIQGMACHWSYEQVRDWLKVECGVSISISALTPFYRRHVEPVLRERKEWALLEAGVLAKKAKDTGVFDDATVSEFKEMAFKQLADPDSDREESRKMMETVLKVNADLREERKLAMLEAKAKRLDALEAKAREIRAEGGLSIETLEMLEKQLKLL